MKINICIFITVIFLTMIGCKDEVKPSQNFVDDCSYRWSLDIELSKQDIIVYDVESNSSTPFSEIPNREGSAFMVIPSSVCPTCLVYQFQKVVEICSKGGIELVILSDSENLRDMLNTFTGCRVYANESGFGIGDEIVPTGPVLYKYQYGAFICGFVLKVNQNEPIEMFFSQCFK